MFDQKLQTAWQLYTQGAYDRSVQVLKEILSEQPEIAFAHTVLAANLIRQKRLHAAEYELSLSLKINPSLSFTHYIFAQLLLFKNKPHRALTQCDEAIALDVENHHVLLLKSEIYQQLGDRDKALSAIKDAAKIAPDSDAVCIAFGEYYLSVGNNSDARTYALQALRMHAQSADANLLKGKVDLALGDTESAAQHAKFVIMQDPKNESALRLLADIKMRDSLFLGLWWRLSAKISTLSLMTSAMMLICAYLSFNFAAQVLRDLGYLTTATIVSVVWIAIAVYSWLCLPLYYRVVKRELAQFKFKPDF